MMAGYWLSQAIYVAAKLGIGDLLKDGPKGSGELAQAAGADPRSVYRLMRALASAGIFRAREDGCFEMTALAAQLQTGVSGSMRAMVIALGEEHYRAWGELLYSVKTGEAAWNHVYEMGIFEYFARHPGAGRKFAEAMTDLTAQISRAVTLAYDFSAISTLVDVGGGHGTLIRAVLGANPKMRGILFDGPAVVEAGQKQIEAAGLSERCQTVAGDFFKSVPAGDAYILKSVIHDWDDDRAAMILRNCRRAMAPEGKVLLIEMIVPSGDEPSFTKLLDLNMLVISGGRERTESEYGALLAAAGFKLTRIVPTMSAMSVIEGEKSD